MSKAFLLMLGLVAAVSGLSVAAVAQGVDTSTKPHLASTTPATTTTPTPVPPPTGTPDTTATSRGPGGMKTPTPPTMPTNPTTPTTPTPTTTPTPPPKPDSGTLTEQQIQACENKGRAYSPETQISGCTAVIQSGRWSGADLAWAFYNRGNGQYDSGQHDKAIADFNVAIQLKPDHANAHANRGLAYEAKGNRDQAIADFRKAYALGDKLSADDLRRLGVTP